MLHFSTFESNSRLIPLDQPSTILQENNIKRSDKNPLILKLETFVNANLHNEQFGVEQLAEMMGMSRSHLHRKLHKVKGKSISRFIREYRLEAARKMLIEKEMTASEVSHAVGFGSPSYFNKCFTEYFGYSPGKARLKVDQEITRNTESKSSKNKIFLWLSGLAAAILIGFLIFSQNKKEAVVAETTPEEKSIIVLPFKNLSSDEENQYLADGMVDAISRHLSGIESLDVLNSSASGPLTSAKEIGEKLNVTNVLKGSLQKHGNVLRVEVQLIDTENEKQLWSEKFDRQVSDMLHIQNEIAKSIAETFDLNLLSNEKSIIDKRTSYNPLAYDYFLKGLHYSRIYNNKNQNLAFENLTKALQIDSTIAPAHLGLATFYHVKASNYFSELSCVEAMSRAKYHIDKAQNLDSDLVEVKAWRAYQNHYYSWDFNTVEDGYKIGMENNLIDAYNVYITFLLNEQRPKEALEICQQLERKFPYYPNNRLVLTYYFLNKWEEANKLAEGRLISEPNNYIVLSDASFFYLNSGEYFKAEEILKKMLEVEGKFLPQAIGYLGAAYAKLGNRLKAVEQLEKLEKYQLKTNAGCPSFFLAVVYTALGEKQEALKWLKTSVDDHEMEVPWLVSEPQLYPLHGMPEFDALVKQVGFREHAYPVELPNRVD